MYEEIKETAKKAVLELIEASGIKAGEILVVGCSSSEIVGGVIGKGSTFWFELDALNELGENNE